MRIRVREGKLSDKGLFRKLQKQYLNDPENEGVLLADTAESETFCDSMFTVAVESEGGFVLFVADKGVVVVTEMTTPGTFKMGKMALIWLAYVSLDGRDQGIEEALFKATVELTKALGYDGVTFSAPSVGKWVEVAEENEFSPFMLHQVKDLREEPDDDAEVD